MATLHDFISEVLDEYKISPSVEVTKVQGVHVNRVYRIDERTTGRSYALHIPKHFDNRQVANEVSIASQLASTEVVVPRVLTNRSHPYYVSEKWGAIITEWLEGYHPNANELSPDDCFTLGKKLAIFHRDVHGLPYENHQQLLTGDMTTWAKQNSHTLVGSAKMRKLWSYALPLSKANLPKGIVHGDYHTNNILLHEDNIHLLDMERAGEGIFLLDLARGAIDICSVHDEFSVPKDMRLLEGYETIRHLTPKEKQLYVNALAYASIAVASWFYDNGLGYLGDRFVNVGMSAVSQLDASVPLEE